MDGDQPVAAAWCAEVNGVVHSEISAVLAERLVIERELLAPLPSLRASIGTAGDPQGRPAVLLRFGSARYSVPVRLIGTQVRVRSEFQPEQKPQIHWHRKPTVDDIGSPLASRWARSA